MNTENNLNILQILISSIIGGGIAGVVVEVVFGFFQRKNERYFNFLKEQISLVYAPLCYLVTQNEIIQTIIEKLIEKAGKKERKDFEEKTNTELSDSEIISEIIKYLNEIIDNNKKIKTLLDKYSYLLDPSDFKILKIFLDNFIRLMHDTNGKLDTYDIEKFQIKGDTSLVDPELNKQIKKVFLEKQKEYRKLYR